VGLLAEPEGRLRLVERFWTLHVGAERALAPRLDGVPSLAFGARRRTRFLRVDLATLGQTAPECLPVWAVEVPGSTAEALGFLYVLEGSTLGGRAVRREMEARGLSMDGLTFLEPYGSDTAHKWRDFLTMLRCEAPSPAGAAADAMVRGAVTGFRHAASCLCDHDRAG
jgi:heme oxygenase